jgi:tRNA threonylcarbamoyladenosine biosynthesis protein TsaB
MFDNKPILAIETSQSLCSTCVYFSVNKYFEMNFKLKNAHAEKLFESIESVLNSAEKKINDIGAIAISAGPGSFTGLRIGMSAAKGMAFGLSLPVIPVPTFEALALQICGFLHDNTEFIIANKINTEEIYFAKFKKSYPNYIFVENLQMLNYEEMNNKLGNTLIFGNASLDSGNNLFSIRQNKDISSPSAKFIARWSEQFGSDKVLNNYEYLEPTYIKNFIVKEKKNVQ